MVDNVECVTSGIANGITLQEEYDFEKTLLPTLGEVDTQMLFLNTIFLNEWYKRFINFGALGSA